MWPTGNDSQNQNYSCMQCDHLETAHKTKTVHACNVTYWKLFTKPKLFMHAIWPTGNNSQNQNCSCMQSDLETTHKTKTVHACNLTWKLLTKPKLFMHETWPVGNYSQIQTNAHACNVSRDLLEMTHNIKTVLAKLFKTVQETTHKTKLQCGMVTTIHKIKVSTHSMWLDGKWWENSNPNCSRKQIDSTLTHLTQHDTEHATNLKSHWHVSFTKTTTTSKKQKTKPVQLVGSSLTSVQQLQYLWRKSIYCSTGVQVVEALVMRLGQGLLHLILCHLVKQTPEDNRLLLDNKD